MNWISKNKKILCENKLFFGVGKIKNIFQSKKTKAVFIVMFLFLASFSTNIVAYGAEEKKQATLETTEQSIKNLVGLGDNIKSLLTHPVGTLLLAVNYACAFLNAAAASLFQWAVDPALVSGDGGVLKNQAIQDVWVMVRDTLNIFFILILLFSAFCTIFQIEKWNLKKIWLNILINALLVNFSFPIARFFIDVSNVAMYYFINGIFGPSTGSLLTDFLSKMNITQLMTAKEFVKSPISLEITIIIVTFIMGMTLLVMAILFVIRLIALAILVMFSPIGFVGYIFPETSEFASKWWKNLFSYAFFGPIMIFMLKVSVSILTAMSDNYTKIISASEMNALDNSQASAIASIAFYPIPIILLWAGMGIAKSMGIAGAETVVNKAQGWGKAIGMRVSGMKFAQDTFRAYQARREQAKGDKASARLGNWLGNKQDFLRGKIPAPLGVGEYGKEHATARYLSADSAKIADETKLHDTANMDETGLRNLATAGNKFAQAAARLELANRGLADGRDLNEMRKLFEGVGRKGEDSQAYKQMQNKMKTYDPVAAFKGDMGKVESFVKSDQFDFKKVGKDSLRNDKFMEIIMDNDKADMKDINNIKDKDKKDAAKSSLITLAKRRNNLSDKKDAKIHAASFSQSGEMVDYSFAEKIFETMDGDSGKKMSITSLNNILAAKPHCLSAINPGKLKEIIASNNNPGVSEAIIQNIINNRAVNRGMEILAKQIEKDPLMRPLIPKKVLP